MRTMHTGRQRLHAGAAGGGGVQVAGAAALLRLPLPVRRLPRLQVGRCLAKTEVEGSTPLFCLTTTKTCMHSEQTDSAEDAAVCELAVQPGDVILAGSDGLWDNCYDAELLPLLPEGPEGAQQVPLHSP